MPGETGQSRVMQASPARVHFVLADDTVHSIVVPYVDAGPKL